jgi:AraC family transcriptional regulator of adaptative response/methylated-DNA-[protein]-cysteine methyltransferase
MPLNQTHNYQKIQTVLEYIQEKYTAQPSLEELAKVVNLSPAHFQRLFSEWVGTSPKKFLQYTTLKHAKRLLKHAKRLPCLMQRIN